MKLFRRIADKMMGGRLWAKPRLSPTDFNFEGGLQGKLNQALGAYLESKGDSSRARFEVIVNDDSKLEISFA